MTAIDLSGKRVLVTGGTRGIGRGIALALAGSGASVTACYRADAEAADRLARDLKEAGGEHRVLKADVSVPDELDLLIAECREWAGGLDAVVANAGTITHIPFAELPAAEWHRVVGTNLTAVYGLVQRALPLMDSGSSVVVVGSRVATVGLPLRAHYTASKAGLIGLVRSLAKELGGRDIRVNNVAPGVIAADDEEVPEEILARYRTLTALGRLGRTAEVAGAVQFLVSDLSRYVTGETLHVDGGI